MWKSVVLTLIFSLCACSVYQSDGRKFLEKNAYAFAGVSALQAQPYLLSCQNEPAAAPWVEQSRTSEAEIFENEGFALRIQPLQATDFTCDYLFSSAQQLVEMTDNAVALTMAKYKDMEHSSQ